MDVTGSVNEWNVKAEAVTGFSKTEVMGMELVAEFIAPEQQEAVRSVLERALAGEETSNYELPLFTKGGERVEVLLNATTRRDAAGEVVGVVGIGQDVTAMKAAQAERDRHALALSRVADVVMDLRIGDWTDPLSSCEVVVANEAYFALFGQETSAGPWPVLCMDREQLLTVLVRVEQSPHAEVRFVRPDKSTRIVRVSTVYMPHHDDRLFVVCHDLTDFKERIELEKDKELVATLQHEEKNAHQAAELDAQRAVDFLGLVRQRMDDQRAVAAKFHSPQLAKLWDDFQAALGTALGDADDAMRSVVERAQRAQQQTHNRIMLRQLVRGEYEPARSPVDVAAKLREQLGRANPVDVRGASGQVRHRGRGKGAPCVPAAPRPRARVA